MILRGSAFNGDLSDPLVGASVRAVVPGSGTVYTASVDTLGQWELELPGNMGNALQLTLSYAGRTRSLFPGERRMGIGPSWDPAFWSVFQQTVGTGTDDRVGVTASPDGRLSVSLLNSIQVSVSAGAVACMEADDYWIASWETATTLANRSYNFSTHTWVANDTTDGTLWCVGVERGPASERAVLVFGLVSGTSVTTYAGTYVDALSGTNSDFVPLALVTASGSSLISVENLFFPLFVGRFAASEQMYYSSSSSSNQVIDGDTDYVTEITGPTIDERMASSYMVEFRGEVALGAGTSDPSWENTESYGSLGSGTAPNFDTPIQVARFSGGNFIIADRQNVRWVILNSSGAHVGAVIGSGQGITGGVDAVAVDSSDNFYIAGYTSTGYLRVRKYSFAGALQWSKDIAGLSPTAMCVTSTNLYVGTTSGTIQVFTLASGTNSSIGSYGSGDGQFLSISGISTDGTYLYVADYTNNRLTKLTVAGAYVSKLSVSGLPYGVAYDSSDGTLWLARLSANLVEQYSTSLVLLDSFSSGTPAGVWAGNDDVYVTDFVQGKLRKYEQTTYPLGEDWANLVVTPDMNIDGVWQDLDFGGSNEALAFLSLGSRPEYVPVRGMAGPVTLADGEETLFRVTLSSSDGDILSTGRNYQFRLLDEGTF